MKTEKLYAMYKGDTFLTIGSLEELAKYKGINKKSVAFYLTKSYKKRIKGKEDRRVILIEV